MTSEIAFWLFSTLFWTAVMSFYSMQEMACISCNKLRLDYSAAQNQRWAVLLSSLLENSTKLFSTTLIGVNVALMLGSESSRQLYHAANYDPNWAPVIYIPFVLVFGELIPMFAARIYADHVSRLGAILLYYNAVLLSPFIAIIDFFFRHANALMGGKDKSKHHSILSRDELQKLLEEYHSGYTGEQETPVSAIMSNIFALRNKRAFQLMQRLDTFSCVATSTPISSIRALATTKDFPCLPVYHRKKQKIVGIVYLQDLLSATDNKKVDEYIKSPCFVTEEMHALELLFRLHDEEVQDAIVLNDKGEALGIILLENIIDELLGPELQASPIDTQQFLYIEKTLPADTPIRDFNKNYGTNIDPEGCKTFAELIEKLLGRYPSANDIVVLDSLEITVKETSLFKAKTILIRTKS